jgi:hypothetical protein
MLFILVRILNLVPFFTVFVMPEALRTEGVDKTDGDCSREKKGENGYNREVELQHSKEENVQNCKDN